MPYICLARSDVPEGMIQVLDLQPNSSQNIPAYTPLGQTRYVNRVRNESSRVRADGTLDEDHIDGLTAYLLDRVDPGGLESASSTLTMTSPHNGEAVNIAGVPFTAIENYASGTAQVNGVSEAAGDTITIGATTFTAKNAGPLGGQEFLDAQAPNTNTTSAASLQSQSDAYFIANVISLTAALTAPGGDTVRFTVKAPAARGLAGEAVVLTQVGVNFNLSGANLVAAVPDPASQQFAGILQAIGGTNAAVATSLRAAIIEVTTSIPLMKAANPGIGDDGAYVSCVAPVGAVLTLRPWCLVTAVPTLITGSNGSLECDSHAVTTLVPDATTLTTLTLNRTHQLWSMTQMMATSAAIIAQMDAGSNLELADINTVLQTNAGGELTAAGGSNSTGVVRELLSILAGRGYRAKRLDAAGVANQYMSVANPLTIWDAKQRGSFTESYAVFGTGMIDGEIKPVNIGGDTENREVSGIRQTVDTDSFQVSLTSGTLARLCAGVDLWIRGSIGVPFFPWTFQRTLTFPEVDAVRILTVYSDTGVVLA